MDDLDEQLRVVGVEIERVKALLLAATTSETGIAHYREIERLLRQKEKQIREEKRQTREEASQIREEKLILLRISGK